MFEPFQDQNQNFFGTVHLSWFVMKSISKTYRFNLFWTKPLRKKLLGPNLDFCKSYFRTNMESNAAFWGPCGPKLLVFKRCVHLLVTNLKLITKALFMNVKFFFLNILKTKCNNVRGRANFTHSCTLLCVVFKIFKKKNFTFIKTAFLNNLRFLSMIAQILCSTLRSWLH